MSLFRASLVVSIISLSAFAQTTFKQSTVPTGTLPAQVIVGDINRDGIPDLITMDQADRAVSVRLGNGDGTFRARSSYAVAGKPVGISTADFQKDGKADIVTVNQDTNNVSILIGNGDGTFQSARNVSVGSGPDSIQVGDFNGDGRTDIATADYNGNTISILPGNGNGTFGTRVVVPAGTQHPEFLVKGDFNGDGKLDLLFSDCCQGVDVAYDTLRVLFNQGSLSFHQVTAFNVSVTEGLTVARVNADAKDDLLVTYQGCHTPCEGGVVYTSNGDGTFTSRGSLYIDVLAYNSPTRAVFADFNGDGRKDAAVAVSCCGEGGYSNTNDQLLIWIQRADGTFASNPQLISLGQGQRPLDIASGDLNRDKKQDLVVALANTNAVRVFVNTTPSSACSAPSSAGIHLCSPTANATVTSPVHISAAATGSISRIEVWVDGAKKYQVSGSKLDTYLAMATGTRRVTAQAVTTTGTVYKSTVYITVK